MDGGTRLSEEVTGRILTILHVLWRQFNINDEIIVHHVVNEITIIFNYTSTPLHKV